MALFLGCLQYALQEGPRWDWLSDNTILAAVVVSGIASAFFFWRVLTYHQPIVDPRGVEIGECRGVVRGRGAWFNCCFRSDPPPSGGSKPTISSGRGSRASPRVNSAAGN
jgi:hypothetical protein